MTRRLAVGAVVVVVLAGAVLAGRVKPPEAATPVRRAVVDGELARCRSVGEAALSDPLCRKAWNAALARFFGRRQEAGR